MAEHVQDRYFAGFGIASVVLMFAGLIIGSTDHDRTLTITSSPAQVARAIGSPAGSGTWAGAYIELLSFGFFLAFAVWACAKLGGGLLGQVARACATSYATLSIASLAVLDAIAYRSGKGISVQLGRALVTVNEALYVGFVVPRRVLSPVRRRPGAFVGASCARAKRNRRRRDPARDDSRAPRQPRPDELHPLAGLDRRCQYRLGAWNEGTSSRASDAAKRVDRENAARRAETSPRPVSSAGFTSGCA